MVDYPFKSILVADPVTFARAANASVTVYAATDTANSTPLALKDMSGLALSNPLSSSADAFLPPFIAQTPDIKLVGGGLTVVESSPEGLRNAAQAAADNAATGAAIRLEDLIAAGDLTGPAGPITNLTVGTVEATPGNPLTDSIIASEITDGTATKAALNAAHPVAAKDTAAGTEAHAQLGPKVRTKGAGAHSVMVLQNNDPASGDNATRVYIVPKGTTTTGVGGALKIFGDDYSTNQTDYRDLGIYFSQNQNGETGTRGDGCFYLNVKTAGTKAGLLPDLVFSMQDGTGVIARASSPIVGGQSKYTFVVGPGKPEHSAKRAMVLEVQGDMGFDGAADRAIYWETTGGASSNVLAFERTASNGNLRLKLGGAQRATFTGSGDLILGDNASDMSTASTVGFLHVRTTNGTPTGTPALYGGAAPMLIDRAGSKLWTYIGGAWKSVTFA